MENDHDLIIKLSTQMTTFCKKLETFHEDNRDDHITLTKLIMDSNNEKTCYRSDISKELDKKVSSSMFKWVVGMIIVSLISLSIYTSNYITLDSIRSVENKHKIEIVLENLPDIKTKIQETNKSTKKR